MPRYMFNKIFLVGVCFFITFSCSHQATTNFSNNPLMDPEKCEKFLHAFMKNIIKYKAFPLQQAEDIADVMETLRQAVANKVYIGTGSSATTKSMILAFASIIADFVVANEDNLPKISIERKTHIVTKALKNAFQETGVTADIYFINEIRRLITLFQAEKKKYHTDHTEKYTNKDVHHDVGIEADIRLDVGVGVDVRADDPLDAAKFELKFAAVLKALKIFDSIGKKSLSRSECYTFSKLLVKFLNTYCHLGLRKSSVKSLFSIFSNLHFSGDMNVYCDAFATFLAPLAATKGLLQNFDRAHRMFTQCFLLAVSACFRVHIDIEGALAAVKTALDSDLDLGVDVDADVGLGIDAGVAALGVVDIGVAAGAAFGINATAGAELYPDVDLDVAVGAGIKADGFSAGLKGVEFASNSHERFVDEYIRDSNSGRENDFIYDSVNDLTKKFAECLQSSEYFNRAVRSGDKHFVLSVISDAIKLSYGDAAGNIFDSVLL